MNLALTYMKLRRNIRRPRREIRALQQVKLHALLRHVWEHSEWHRERLMAAGITEDSLDSVALSDLPTMEKDDLLQNFDRLVTDPRLTQAALRAIDSDDHRGEATFLGQYHVVHSSGSTGKPAYFVYDGAAWHTMLAGIIRGALWEMSLPGIAGLFLRRARILYVAATDGRYGGAMAVGDGVSDMGLCQRSLDINAPVEDWTAMLRDYLPNVVIGYPSAVKLLCDIASERGIGFMPERIITCGEPLSPGLRDWLKARLHAKIINFYGASESLALGVEGERGDGMRLFDDLNIIEVIDGEMYVTCLYNFTQPLIRYHITDRLRLRLEPQAGFSGAEVLLSRDEDILWFRDASGRKEFLHPLAIEGFCYDGLTDYQFVKHDNSSFTMLAVAEPSRQPCILPQLREHMARILESNHLSWVDFRLRFVREILPDARTGKKKLIVLDDNLCTAH